MNKLEQAVELTSQLVDMAQLIDDEHKKRALAAHKGSQATGDSRILFHLKELLNLLKEIK